MDPDTAAKIDAGRSLMRAAFAEVLDLAARAGADREGLRQLQWSFFDGNQAINEALSR